MSYNKRQLQKDKKELTKAKAPGTPKDIIYDPRGQWAHPGQPTRIPGNQITMQGVPYPVYGVDNTGYGQMMYPGADYTFPGSYVDEYPQLKKGGIPKLVKLPNKKGSKGYSRSLEATNKLFTENKVFDKPKSRKKKVFDPSSKYYQDGGFKTKLNPEEENEFQNFYNTLPDNLMSDEPDYDIRGYWDALGRPSEFDYSQPKESDGYYHAFSINPNTGEYLKAPFHNTFQHAITEDRKMGWRPTVNVQGRIIATENPYIADPEEQTFLRNTEGPVEYQKGGVKTTKSKDGTITNKFVNKEGNTVVQVKTKDGRYYEKVLEPQIKPLDNTPRYQNALLNNPAVVADNTRVANADFAAEAVLNKPNVDAAVKADKKAQYEFEKNKWDYYNKQDLADQIGDRAKGFMVDPLGMLSRLVTGEQAYIPGMGDGLLNKESPDYNRYLRSVGYTPGKFEISDVQNMLNPMYWGASIGSNMKRGNYGAAATEAALTFLPFAPKGTASTVMQGARMIGDDVARIRNFLRQTPLENKSVQTVLNNAPEQVISLGRVPGMPIRPLPNSDLVLNNRLNLTESLNTMRGSGSIEIDPLTDLQQKFLRELQLSNNNISDPAYRLNESFDEILNRIRTVKSEEEVNQLLRFRSYYDDIANRQRVATNRDFNALFNEPQNINIRSNESLTDQINRIAQGGLRGQDIIINVANLSGKAKGAAKTLNEKLSDFKSNLTKTLNNINAKLGQKLDSKKIKDLKKPISTQDVELEVNKLLEEGLGIKKGDIPIKVVSNERGKVQVLIKPKKFFEGNKKLIEDVYGEGSYDEWIKSVTDEWIDSGYLQLYSTPGQTATNRSFTDILFGKPMVPTTKFGDHFELNIPTPGLKRSGDFPFQNWDSRFREAILDNLGISGELTQAYNKALKNKGYAAYSGGTGHLEPGAKRYLRELLNQRVEITNPELAENLNNLLKNESVMQDVEKALKNRNVSLPKNVLNAVQPLIFKYKRNGGMLNSSLELQQRQDGGIQEGLYSFSGRPGSEYKYQHGQWYIANKGTNNIYVPMEDPSGNRAKTLMAGIKSGKTKMLGQVPATQNKTRYQNTIPNIAVDNTRVVNADFAAAAVANKPNVDRAVAAEKKAQYEFEKNKWDYYNKQDLVNQIGDRAKAFMVDPLGMASRFVSGEQAYIPGMGDALVNYEDPNRDRYLQAVGYTPGKFEASDIQNMVNPAYWGASIGSNMKRGNYGTAAIEGALTFAPFLPKGSGSLIKQGAGMIADDISKAGEYLTTKTPLRNAWRLNPKAYQYNLPANTMWRGLGQEGMEDAIASGLFRSKQNVIPEYYPSTSLQLNKSFGENPYFTPKFNTAATYGNNFLAEVPRDVANWTNRYGRGKTWSQVADKPIPIDEGRILQKDWLRGYKPIEAPKQLPGSPNASGSKQFTTRGPIGQNIGTGLTEEDIAKTIQNQVDWITSEEYFKRRSANTGETYDQIQRDVNKTINNAKDAKFDVNAKLSGKIQGEQTPRSLNTFWGPPTVDISSAANNPLMVLEHETGHLYSPAGFSTDDVKLHRGYDNPNVADLPANKRGIYANYPSLGDKLKDDYLQLGYEQQVRHLNARNQILDKFNLPKDTQLNEDQVRQFVDDWATKMNNRVEGWEAKGSNYKYGKEQDYDDLWEEEFDLIRKQLLEKKYGVDDADFLKNLPEEEKKLFRQEVRRTFEKKLTDVLNKAWVAVPIAIGAGAAATQQSESTQPKMQKGGPVFVTSNKNTPKFIGSGKVKLPEVYKNTGMITIPKVKQEPKKEEVVNKSVPRKPGEPVFVNKNAKPAVIIGNTDKPKVVVSNKSATPFQDIINPFVAQTKETMQAQAKARSKTPFQDIVDPFIAKTKEIAKAQEQSRSKTPFQDILNPIVDKAEKNYKNAIEQNKKPLNPNFFVDPTITGTFEKMSPEELQKYAVNEEEEESGVKVQENPKVKKYKGTIAVLDKKLQSAYYNLTNPNLSGNEKLKANARYKELMGKRNDYVTAINKVKAEDVGWFDAWINDNPEIGKPAQKFGLADEPSYMTYDLPKFESYTDLENKKQEEYKQSTRFEELNPNKSQFTRWKFRAAASNDEPLKVQLYGTRGEREKENVNIKTKGAIMHFLDQSPKSGFITKETKNFYKKLKPTDYIGYLKQNEDGTHSLQYKPKKEFTDSNIYNNTFLVRQVKFDDIDFKRKAEDDNFSGHTYPMLKGTTEVALPISSGPDENIYDYSSGQSVVFIFKYNGKLRYQHFAGSRNEIKKEGEDIKKMYNLKDKELTLGLADAGSYSSAISGNLTNNKLNNKDYGYYNRNSYTGAGMAIVTE